ncbi:MAG: NusG domain II-containing protein [Synergistaceae bacterium]|jgi:hypothetical protein|nr:NusG domain II-containing protein [Synergistaceae bacterium]
MKSKDKALYLAILFFTAIVWMITAISGGGAGEFFLEITADGKSIKSVELSGIEPGASITLHEGGGMNELLISGNAVRMISSDCPGGDCLKMAPLVSERGAIVCLPHRLVIKLRRKDEDRNSGGIDAISY